MQWSVVEGLTLPYRFAIFSASDQLPGSPNRTAIKGRCFHSMYQIMPVGVHIIQNQDAHLSASRHLPEDDKDAKYDDEMTGSLIVG